MKPVVSNCVQTANLGALLWQASHVASLEGGLLALCVTGMAFGVVGLLMCIWSPA